MASIARRLYTAEEFLDEYSCVPGKHELIRGEVYNMAGATGRHGLVCTNVARTLGNQLAATSCRAFSEMGVALADESVLYPDVSLFCDRRDLDQLDERRFRHPSFVVEVLSPSTRTYDLNEKLALYKDVESLRAILYIDPVSEVLFWHNRTKTGWRADWLTPPEELDLTGFDFTLPRADIFAR